MFRTERSFYRHFQEEESAASSQLGHPRCVCNPEAAAIAGDMVGLNPNRLPLHCQHELKVESLLFERKGTVLLELGCPTRVSELES